MSQVWKLPLETTQLLSDSRDDINTGFAALKSTFLGTVDPTSDFEDGMIWVNQTVLSGDTAGKINQRFVGSPSTTVELGDYGVPDMGHIRKDGAIAFTADQSMGGKELTNLLDPPSASTNAATKAYADLKVAKTGGKMSGQLELTSDGGTTPLDGSQPWHAATTKQVDAKLGTTGTQAMQGVAGWITWSQDASDRDPDDDTGTGIDILAPLSKAQLRIFKTFSTTTGHDHNGINSRGVVLTAGRAASEPTRKFLESDGAAPSAARWTTVPTQKVLDPIVEALFADGATILVPGGTPIDSNWVSVDLSSHLEKDSASNTTATWALMKWTVSNVASIKVHIRRGGSSTAAAVSDVYDYRPQSSTANTFGVTSAPLHSAGDYTILSWQSPIMVPLSILGKFDYVTDDTTPAGVAGSWWLLAYG